MSLAAEVHTQSAPVDVTGPSLDETQSLILDLEGVQGCRIFTHEGRNHVVLTAGPLAKVAMLLDAALGDGNYDLTYIGR